MAIARDSVAANIKPLEGSVIRRFKLGATTEAGEYVVMQSDGKVDPGAATAVQAPLGIALQGGVDTNIVDVVVFGPVQCLTGATIGAIVYAGDTAGEPVETAGTKSAVLGVAESATVLFVRPATVAFT
jgi:hypothetical protein